MLEEQDFDIELQNACCNGNYEDVVDLVENKGCNPSGKEDLQKPLSLASGSGHIQIVEYLLQQGADVNGTDLNDESALMSAVIYNQSLQIVQILLEHGADVNRRDIRNMSVLEWATQRSTDEIVNFLNNYINHRGA
jgi:ankyrin repeat protein